MRPIRIALTDLQQSLRRLVEMGVADQPDLTLVDDDVGDINLMLTARDIDVVIAQMVSGEPPALVERLLDENPLLGVVCVDAVTGQGLVCRLQPRATRMATDSPDMIVEAIRLANTDWSSDDLRR